MISPVFSPDIVLAKAGPCPLRRHGQSSGAPNGGAELTTGKVKDSVKQCHKPPLWEWYIPPIKMVISAMVYYCFYHSRFQRGIV